MEFFLELWNFLKYRKKIWMAPIIIILILIGSLVIIAQGSVVGPLMYAIF